MTASLSSAAIQAFVDAFPGMAVCPAVDVQVTFQGEFRFSATSGEIEVTDAYQLRILVPSYPDALPRVFEIGGRIPPVADEHAFPDGRLCLGSALRLRTIIGKKLDLVDFADRCIVPFLYATTRRATEGHFVFGELDHGAAGLVADYRDLLGVRDEAGVRAALRLLTTKPTSADRHRCPCGCGRRLAQCEYRDRICEFRALASRKSFREIFDATFPARQKK
jgi:hypothetical protein